MLKKFLACAMALLLMAVPALASAVTLTMGSWRADDVAQMNALLAIYQEKTGVEIQFQPTTPADYNATLRLQLDTGTGPDLMYARSYETGRELYAAGYFADCTNIPGLKENFTVSSLEPWQNADGSMFAVPFAAVSHAVYYNKDIFEAQGIAVPETWEDFIAVCESLKAAGITPLANGVAEEWDILECFFLGMLPNYVGGAAERAKYESGEKALNDEAFVAAYTDFASIAPYLPDGFTATTYNDSQILFATGRAAMFVDGSWTCGTYADVDFDWSVFAVPAPAGSDTRVTFHPDMAITANASTAYPDETEAFLTWLCSVEGATEASKVLPAGFFPMINAPIEIEEPHANAILALNAGKETDARFVWPALMSLYTPMNQAIIQLLTGKLTPQQAADQVAAVVAE
ncbi:MAG: extracellular solute-binding protein [Oscillospiraceae bacterium]|nr:extracellular solute-binding protein [Oscillospiraceae bacterium]